jgi:hypothetical protein
VFPSAPSPPSLPPASPVESVLLESVLLDSSRIRISNSLRGSNMIQYNKNCQEREKIKSLVAVAVSRAESGLCSNDREKLRVALKSLKRTQKSASSQKCGLIRSA